MLSNRNTEETFHPDISELKLVALLKQLLKVVTSDTSQLEIFPLKAEHPENICDKSSFPEMSQLFRS